MKKQLTKIIWLLLTFVGGALWGVPTYGEESHGNLVTSTFGSNTELPTGTHYWDNNGVNGTLCIYRSVWDANQNYWVFPTYHIYALGGCGSYGGGVHELYDTRTTGAEPYLVVWQNVSGTDQVVSNDPQAPFYVYQYGANQTCYKVRPAFPAGAPNWAVWLVWVDKNRADELFVGLIDYGYNASLPPSVDVYDSLAN